MRKILLGIVIFSLLFPGLPVYAQSDEGYGEEQTALGQFVDSFETSGNISVTDDVIRNTTLEAMELNITALQPDYENYTEYTVVDENGDLTITDQEIVFDSIRRDADTYVSYDYGVNFFDEFIHYVDVNVSDVEAGDASNRGIVIAWDVSNADGDWDLVLASDSILVILNQVGATDDVYAFLISWREAGVSQGASTGITRNVDEEVYLIMNRTDDDFIFQVYEDSARTILNETLSINNISNTQFRYIHALCGFAHAGDPADHGSGTLQNLWLGNYSGGFELDGYFETVDYLSDPIANGLSLVAMVNTSIPANTNILLQFSNDSAIWTDNVGTPGASMTLTGNFESIDLRDLNHSNAFHYRFNLSTSDNLITPRVYQSRLITTEGSSTGAAGAGANWWIIIGVILIPVAVFIAVKKR